MSLEIAQLLISGFSALSSLVQAYNSTRDKKKGSQSLDKGDFKYSGARGSVPIRKKAIMTHNEAENSAVALNKVIDNDLLDVMLKNIRGAIKRLKKGLIDPANSNQTKDNEVKIAQSIICSELSRIMNLNNGRLPNEYLEKLWFSHNCAI